MNDMPVFGPDQANTKTALEDIAINTGTPIEVLFAAGEQAGAKTPQDFLRIATERGQQLGPRFKAGEDPTAIVTELFGAEAQRSFGDYAAEIRSQLYGAPAPTKQQERPQEANAFRDAPAAVAASVVRSGGSIVRGLGEGISAAADVAKGIAEPVVEGALAREVEFFDRKAPNVLSGVADAIGGDQGATGFLDSFVSEEVKRDVQDFIDPEADLFDTSTWKMGPRPTVRGAIFSAVDVFGSMAPIVAAGLLTGGVGAAATGGLMSGGFGAEESGALIDEMATTRGPDGRTRLEAESSVYQREIANGSTPEEAKEFTKRSAEQLSAVFASVPGALGGAATNAIVRGAGRVAGRLPWYASIPAAGVISGAEEGVQEVAEGVAARTAANIGAGINESITEGTLSEFVVGAMGGAPMGAGAAGIEAYRNRTRPANDPNAGSDQGAVPPGADPASGPVPPVAPPTVPQGGPTPTADVLRPQAVDPLDPAGQRPAAPSPMSDALAGAPEPMFGNVQSGDPVQIQFVDPETGEISDPVPATFVGEDPAQGYASFRDATGAAGEIDLAEIASGSIIITPAGAAQGGAAAPVPAPQAPAPVQAAPLPPIPQGVDPDNFMEHVAMREAEGMSPDEAYQYTLRGFLDAMREDVGTIADDVEDRQRQAREEQSRLDEAVFTDSQGQPFVFPTEAAALGRLGAGYTVEPFGNGFIGVRQQEAAGNEGNGNDGVGSDGGIADGGGNLADRGGDGGAPVDTGRDGEQLGPVAQGTQEGVADATGAADADVALTPSPVDDSATADPVANADQETDPMRAAVRDAIAAGPVQHTTRKGKVLDGYILKGVKPAQVKDTLDPYAFPKDGGTFVRKDKADTLADGGSATAGDDISKVVSTLNKALKPENQEMADWYISGSIGVQLDPTADGDIQIGVTTYKTRYKGRVKETSENTKNYLYSKVRDSLSAEARDAVEQYIAQDAAEDQVQATPAAEATPAPDAPKKGDTWEFWGNDGPSKKTIIDVQQRDGETRYLVQEDGERSADILSQDDVDTIKQVDAANMVSRARDQAKRVEREATEAQAKAEAEDLDGFDAGMEPMQRGRAIKTLSHQMRWDGVVMSRRDRIRQLVAEGATVQDMGADGTSLVRGPDDTYMPQSDLTQIGARYAQFLIDKKKSDAAEAKPVAKPKGDLDRYARAYEAHRSVLLDPEGKTVTFSGDDVVYDKFRLSSAEYEGLVSDLQGQGLLDNEAKPVNAGPRLTTREQGRAAGEAWAAQGKSETMRDDPAMGNASGDAQGGWSNGYRAAKQTAATETAPQPAPKPAPAPAPKPQPEPQPAPAKQALSSLSKTEQDRGAFLRARIADRLKNQTNMGVDPAILQDAIELTGLYIKDGYRKFRSLLDQVASDMGMTAKEAEPWVRAGYTQARDNLEIDGEDVSDMDSSADVVAAVRALRAEADAPQEQVQPPAEGANLNPDQTESANGPELVQDPEQDTGGDGPDGQPAGNEGNQSLEGAQPEDGGADAGPRGAGGGGTRSGGSNASGGRSKSGRGNAANRRKGAGGAGLASDGAGVRPRNGRNYVISDPEAVMGGTPMVRFKRNQSAIEAFNDIIADGREATREELDVIAGYTGWGSFGQELFQGSWERPRPKEGWEARDTWMRDHLGEAAWKSAQSSILNAHYTDPPTVQAMWQMVEAMGFKGGRVLEPSMGIGNFFGLMPTNLALASDLTGIELDQTTGGMAKLLYPDANVSVKGYEKSLTPDGFYDLVIGNWPFAAQGPADRRYRKLSPSLHDYFFVKALDQTRPGGLVVGVTSSGTMDKATVAVRQHLAKNAELVASFRLPTGAFEKYAGTKVVTDIIILRKRETPILDASNEPWIKATEVATPAGTDVRVNEYYQANPDNILGTLNFGSGTTFGRAGMIVDRPADLADRLAALPSRVPTDAFKPITRGKEERFLTNNEQDRNNSLVIAEDGDLWVAKGDRLVPLADIAPYAVKSVKETEKRKDALRDLVRIRKAYGATIDAERDGLPDTEPKRKKLNDLYQRFRKKNGPISDSHAIKTLTKIEDPNAAMLKALERRDKDRTPSQVLSEPLVRSRLNIDKPSVADAFVIARNETAKLDLDRVAELAKADRQEVEARLLESKAIYRMPGGGFEISDLFLSGNVRRRLRELEASRDEGDTTLNDSIEAIKAVVPEDVPYYKIEAQMGATWMGGDTFVSFTREILGLTEDQARSVNINMIGGTWSVKFENRNLLDKPEATTQHGLQAIKFDRLLRAALNNETIKITRRDPETGKPMTDEASTKAANEKAEKLRETFREWVWNDPERRVDLAADYNEAMNAISEGSYDGSFLEFPGMALKRGTSAFSLRSHQVNAIWRGIAKGRGIYAHEVGTGKTYTMAGIAVESRRYGLARKPMIVAHNANSATVAAEVNDMYPGAKVLYVNNLAPETIKETLFSIRNDDWDAVVIPHSLLDRMALSEDTIRAMTADDIAALEAAALEAAQDDSVSLSLADMDDEKKMNQLRSVTAKELVKARNALIAKVESNIIKATREDAVTFEDLGVDMLLVDEVHEFKKPQFVTKMRMKGLQSQTSGRSLQLQFLTRYIKQVNNNRGVHIFTGTPITNTLTEMFHMMRYAMEDVMGESSVGEWDGWFNTFAAAEADLELASDGQFETVSRLSSFVNVAELRRMAGEYLDIVFADDMPEFAPRPTASGKTLDDKTLTKAEEKELREGRSEEPVGRPYKKIVNETAEMTPDQRAVQQDLAERYNFFRQASKKDRQKIIKAKADNPMSRYNPLIISLEADAAAFDIRLRNPERADSPTSKVNRALVNVMSHYNEDPRATQVIFMDKGYTNTGKSGGQTVPRTNIAQDIKKKLIEQGVKASEIAIVTGTTSKEKRKEIADKMNRSEIRIVIGGTQTLGVGVNMQQNLRAMHHLDAPWMPGELEQRNGRGHRQGNKWNTVFEYRYMTERLDGKRWQTLAKKMRFITDFLKADFNTRVIDGDATSTEESVSADDIMESLSEAAGDPRILQVAKLKMQVEKLSRRQSNHEKGMVESARSAVRIRSDVDRMRAELSKFQQDADHVAKIRADETFSAKIGDKTYNVRADAIEALETYMEGWTLPKGADRNKAYPVGVSVNGFKVEATEGYWGVSYNMSRTGLYSIGKASVAAIESNARQIAPYIVKQKEQIEESIASAERLEKASKEEFAQTEALQQKQDQLEALEFDLQANPIPAPTWLRQGTPIDTKVFVDGAERVVTGHRWGPESYFVLTDEGDVDYRDARGQDGGRIYDDMDWIAPPAAAARNADSDSPSSAAPTPAPDAPRPMQEIEAANDPKTEDEMRLEDDGGPAAAEMRGDDPAAADPAFTEDASRAVTRRLVAEVAKVLPGTKVGVRLVRQLYSLKDGAPIMGRANRDGTVEVSARAARDEAGAVGILNHEIIHVLRNADLWRAPEGLFTGREWPRLVAAAEANLDLVAAVNANYEGKGLTREQLQEEYVAEMYRGWKAQTGDYGAVEKVLLKIEEFFRALASAFRGEGFDSAGMVMQRIADGGVGARADTVASADMSSAIPAEMRASGNPDPIAYPSVVASLSKMWSSKPATSEAALNAKEGNFVSNLITNAMASNDKMNVLGLVPGEVLFRDLGKNLASAGQWIKTMRQMTAERQEMHAESDVLAREWQGEYVKDKVNGRKLHDLMHETTIEQTDPSERFRAPRKPLDMTTAQYMNYVEDKRAKHAELRQKFNALPEKMQDFYRRVRDAYKDFDSKLIDAQADAVVKAMGLQADRLKARYEGELQQFKDDGLEGDALKEARRKARSKYNQDVKMLEFSRNARIRKMRLIHETNRLEGPYFPLVRFGQFFVAARDDKGKLVHFERATTAGAMNRIEAEMKAAGFVVDKGVMKPDDNISRFVDPNFVADITEAMGEAGADSQILDAIYQRYLETLPSFSIRKANIHRQGVPGFDKDAIKAFGNRMFHGAHQLTRLRHSMDLTKHIENARREATRASDPVRAGAVVNEMQKRHDWSMNPQGASWSAWATSTAFVWYLGLTPGAAIVNLTQTTVVGIPLLAAGIEGGTVAKAAKHLSGALADFTAGLKKGDAEWSRGALTSGRLSADERAALQAAYNSGALDKSQAHDIAAIGDSGVEYSAVREKAMRPIAFLFHHAERLNREVTFLAAYRMAKEAGMDTDAAQQKAADLTWDTHFNYENWSRPRFMQGDVSRVIHVFRQFQVNMLYRLFRDAHQSLKGESPEVRKQARAQLIGMTGSMMVHAGITGTWGYALMMMLAGMFFEGGSDEAEEELKNAVVSTFGAGAGGLLLKGVPGHLTGTDMTARIGMPELWFRSPNRQLEGAESYQHWMEQLVGAVPAIGKNMMRGVQTVNDGEVWKGMELMVPKAVRDQMRFMRYLNEGVTTRRGDPLMDDVSAHDAIVQAIGFSPARISERYEQNRRMMNAQGRIEDERRKILSDITRYMREGKEVSPRAERRMEEFNQKYPLFQIEAGTIKRSLQQRERISQQMDGGIRMNQKLAPGIKEDMAPSLYR